MGTRQLPPTGIIYYMLFHLKFSTAIFITIKSDVQGLCTCKTSFVDDLTKHALCLVKYLTAHKHALDYIQTGNNKQYCPGDYFLRPDEARSIRREVVFLVVFFWVFFWSTFMAFLTSATLSTPVVRPPRAPAVQ